MQMDIIAGATLGIDLAALADNYRTIQRQVAPAWVAAVVKADAYGLGAARVVKWLQAEGCQHFFVAHLSEAIGLRNLVSPLGTIFILNGLQPGAETACVAIGAMPVSNSLYQIEQWNNLGMVRGERLKAALQVDSGIARLGLPPAEIAQLLAEPHRLSYVEICLLMSHLACRRQSVESTPDNAKQEQMRFKDAAEHGGYPRILSYSSLSGPGHSLRYVLRKRSTFPSDSGGKLLWAWRFVKRGRAFGYRDPRLFVYCPDMNGRCDLVAAVQRSGAQDRHIGNNAIAVGNTSGTGCAAEMLRGHCLHTFELKTMDSPVQFQKRLG